MYTLFKNALYSFLRVIPFCRDHLSISKAAFAPNLWGREHFPFGLYVRRL